MGEKGAEQDQPGPQTVRWMGAALHALASPTLGLDNSF